MKTAKWIPPLNDKENGVLTQIMSNLDRLDVGSQKLVVSTLRDSLEREPGSSASYQPWPMFPEPNF